MKISPNTKPAALLKDFDPSFVDLLEKMLIFNPKKRIDIDDILAHEIVKPFRKI
jgi:serine/threonine protein kinase